jgi:hypothetical protein
MLKAGYGSAGKVVEETDSASADGTNFGTPSENAGRKWEYGTSLERGGTSSHATRPPVIAATKINPAATSTPAAHTL